LDWRILYPALGDPQPESLATSPSPDEDPGAPQGPLLHAVPGSVPLVEPPRRDVPTLMAVLAEVVAAALRAVQAVEASSQNGHHPTRIAADAGMDLAVQRAHIINVAGSPRRQAAAPFPDFLAAAGVLAPELFLHVLAQVDADAGKRPGVVHAAEDARVGRPSRRARPAHEVPAVERHGLKQQLLAHLASEDALRVRVPGRRRRRRHGVDRRRVQVLVTLLRCDLRRPCGVLARVHRLQEMVQLGGDSRQVHIRLLTHRAVRDGVRAHGSVHAPETEHVPAPLHHRLVRQLQAYRTAERLP
jgi:hypothetical protein